MKTNLILAIAFGFLASSALLADEGKDESGKGKRGKDHQKQLEKREDKAWQQEQKFREQERKRIRQERDRWLKEQQDRREELKKAEEQRFKEQQKAAERERKLHGERQPHDDYASGFFPPGPVYPPVPYQSYFYGGASGYGASPGSPAFPTPFPFPYPQAGYFSGFGDQRFYRGTQPPMLLPPFAPEGLPAPQSQSDHR